MLLVVLALESFCLGIKPPLGNRVAIIRQGIIVISAISMVWPCCVCRCVVVRCLTRCSEGCLEGCLAGGVVERTAATPLAPFCVAAAMPGIAATSAGRRDDWRRAGGAAEGSDGFFARLAVSLIALSCRNVWQQVSLKQRNRAHNSWADYATSWTKSKDR